ncbi:DUF5691 domain-containing protein [Hymenobacter mucosus]|uniref:Uncharacterized protein n=1 Tax=Hymenobacter mucosus TaxID=1411120 RepID=A0A238V4I6_9BACT|nr:DUF5691 domain-containing protein [Hymenobacter mucosus]SNR29128.1 hypothetical protein SAMN06269173_10196 [Hymenobacter mucosus]
MLPEHAPDQVESSWHPTADWQRLLRVALLGTQQSPDAVPAVPGLPTAPETDAAAREKQLLLTAGGLSLIRKAGYQPAPAPSATPEQLPAETQVPLGPSGGRLLHLLLEGQYPDLLPDFLTTLANHSRRVPSQLLVRLLDYVHSRPALHPLAAAVLGQRGAWLAAQHPNWQAVLATTGPAPHAATWETGTLRQRVRYLEALRRTNAEQAREQLAAVLPQEPAKNQASLLASLQEGLSAADAPLLEWYLVSKSKEVRQTVQPLVACLPDSALVGRVWQRAEPLIRLRKTLTATKLVVELPPDAWDKSWLADGVEQHDSRFQGDRATLLGQLLALLPPQRWANYWQLPPAAILNAAAATEWGALLFNGWAEATILHHASTWALALLTWWAELPRKHPFSLPLAGLAQQLSTDQLTKLVLPLLDSAPEFGPEVRWLPLLQLIPGPWSEPLTRRVVEALRQALNQPERLHRIHYAASQLLEHMARVVPATHYELCAQPLQPLLQDVPYLHNSLARLLNTLHFRQQLTDALHEAPA